MATISENGIAVDSPVVTQQETPAIDVTSAAVIATEENQAKDAAVLNQTGEAVAETAVVKPVKTDEKSTAVKRAPIKSATVKATTVKAAADKVGAKPVSSKKVAVKPALTGAAPKVIKTVAGKTAAAKLPAAKKAETIDVLTSAVAVKVKKDKLIRDSFTMPESEYAVLGQVKKACLAAGVEVKKSQLLRVGLHLLNQADVASLKVMLDNLAPLKAGRPKKDK